MSGGFASPFGSVTKARHAEAYCGAAVKLLSALADGSDEAQSLVDLSSGEGWRERWSVTKVRNQAPKSLKPGSRIPTAWKVMWDAIIDDMHSDFLLSNGERTKLKEQALKLMDDPEAGLKAQHIDSKEARRRLQFFLRSLQKPEMPASEGALKCPSLTVVIPMFEEALTPDLYGTAPLDEKAKAGAGNGGPGYKELSKDEEGMLRAFFRTEYKKHLKERVKVRSVPDAQMLRLEMLRARRPTFSPPKTRCGSH